MPVNATYSLTGTGISIAYTTGAGDLELTLDDSFRPFDGTHNLTSADVRQQGAVVAHARRTGYACCERRRIAQPSQGLRRRYALRS